VVEHDRPHGAQNLLAVAKALAATPLPRPAS